MKNLFKKLMIGLLGLALAMGTTLSFVACGDTETAEKPPAVQTGPNDSDNDDDTEKDKTDEETEKNPSASDGKTDGDDNDDTGNDDNMGDDNNDDKDDEDHGATDGDEQQEERFFPLAYIGERIKDLYGYEVLGFFEFRNPNTDALYLAFVSEIFDPEIGIEERRMSRIIIDIRLEEHRLADIIALENAPTQDSAKAKELKTFLENEFSAIKHISNVTVYDAYLNGYEHTTESNREYTERVLSVLLKNYAQKLGNYKIIFGCLGTLPSSGVLDANWGNLVPIYINAAILSEDQTTVYQYENTVYVAEYYKTLNVKTVYDCILLKEQNINAYKDYDPENALTELISGIYAEEYVKSVTGKAAYEANKAAISAN